VAMALSGLGNLPPFCQPLNLIRHAVCIAPPPSKISATNLESTYSSASVEDLHVFHERFRKNKDSRSWDKRKRCLYLVI
jgi:hypothetical protein